MYMYICIYVYRGSIPTSGSFWELLPYDSTILKPQQMTPAATRKSW